MKQVTVSIAKKSRLRRCAASASRLFAINELQNNHKSSWCQFLKVGRIRAALNYLSEHKGP
jgi:hypothetical protein